MKKVLKESMKKSGRSWVRVIGISAAAAILVFLAVMRFLRVPSLLIRAGLAVSILVLLGLVVFELTRRKKTVLLEEPDEMSRTIQKLQWNVEYLQQEIQGKRTAAENLEQEYREYCLACAEKDPLETDLEGVRLALETIGKLSADMEKRVGAALKRRMSEILARITDGKYLSVSLDQELNMGLHTKDYYVPLNQVSRGTMEQVYFALRMAATELLCAEEPLPVLLDEVFAMYDDRRLAGVLEWLAGQNRQVLIFTCQDREEKILQRRQIPYRKVTLP